MKNFILIVFLVTTLSAFAQKRNPKNKAVFLEDISWTIAKQLLIPDAVIIIPLGAGAKEHGPHLPLSTDFLQAEDCINRLALERNVIITPTINYGFYPAFIKYAGSTSLSFSTSTDMVLQIVRTLSNYGPKRFYIINIGISTTPTLAIAANILATSGILLFYSDYSRPAFLNADKQIATKAFGGHADEIETSNILSIRPDLVDMSKAVDDTFPKGKKGVLTPTAIQGGILDRSGIVGYATLATKEKGILSMTAFTNNVIKEIDSISNCPLPKEKDRTNEYKLYEGKYIDTAGTKLIISQNNDKLYFIWNGRDLTNFFPLYRDAEDHFTSLIMNVLFVKNEKGEVTKAWCQSSGINFWVTKVK